jgi:predicted Zn-dependent protease
MGRYPEALEASRRAVASDSQHRSAHYALATALLRIGRPEEGRRELEIFQRMQADAIAAAQRESELKALRLNAARRVSDGDFAAAAPLLRQALTRDPNDAAVHRDLGAALIKVGRFAEAIVVLDQSLTLEDTAEAHELLAKADAALNRPADSQAQLALAARALARLKEDRLRRIRGSR